MANGGKQFGDEFTLVGVSPAEIQRLYEDGFPGAFKSPEQDEQFDAESPDFATAAAPIAGSGEGKVALLYKFVLGFDDDAYRTAQKTGDCVSHATRNAVDATRAVEIAVRGEPEGFYTKSATEAIYGSRGHGGQGMSCSGASRFVTTTGGVLLRRDYTEEFGHDLSEYSGSYRLGMGWGRSGVPEKVKAEARKHQVGTSIRVRDIEQARDLLANGYGISACSGLGFSNKRDSEGVSPRRGSWSHAMAWLGVDAAPETVRKHRGPLFLIQNSWGRFNSGPKRHDQPDGSFWVSPKDAASILRANGAFAFSNVNGFPPQDLPDAGFNY